MDKTIRGIYMRKGFKLQSVPKIYRLYEILSTDLSIRDYCASLARFIERYGTQTN